MPDIGSDLTALEARVNVVEQRSPLTHAPAISVVPDPVTGVSTVHDSLTWNAGWESWTRMQTSPSLAWVNPSGGAASHGPAQALRIGSMGFLTGVVLRTISGLAAGTRYDGLMFDLPTGWRPRFRVTLNCLTGGTSPDSDGGPVGAWIEVRPDLDRAAGGVYYVVGGAALPAGSGWIALQGAFPCADVPGP